MQTIVAVARSIGKGPAGTMAGKGVEMCVMVDATRIETRTSVLLVEDEPLISDITAEALTEQGFEVESVSSAIDALRHLEAGCRIDVLFTDVALAGDMDGATLVRRARELRPGLPVIYTSGRRSVIDQLEPVEGAMFVPKPYDPFNLGRLLEYLVVAKRTHTQAFV
jgi:DNA-binding NtrC family response regulator